MKITKPEMIIFDYGHTLLCEPDWNSDRGNVELMKYIVKNPNNCTIEDIQSEVNKTSGEIESVRNTLGYDIPARVGNRLAFRTFGHRIFIDAFGSRNNFLDCCFTKEQLCLMQMK